VNFIVGGRVLFGEEMDAWSTYPKAASAAVMMLVGTFHIDELYGLYPIAATIWFWLFLISVVFLFLQVLTALMLNHFKTFRGIIGRTDSVLYDGIQGMKELLWRIQWRWENIKDREFLAAISNPYDELQEGLMQAAKIPEDMGVMASESCLGLRLAVCMQDNLSLEGLKNDLKKNADPRIEKVESLELRTLGADPMTAEHILEETDAAVRYHDSFDRETAPSELQQLRVFRRLLARHSETLAYQCDQIEAGVEEEQVALDEDLMRFENSVVEALQGLAELRLTQVDSLALPPPKLPFMGTTLRDTYTSRLGKDPPRMGTAQVAGRNGLRVAAGGGPAALGDRSAEATRGSPAQPAIGNLADAPPSRKVVPAIANNGTLS